MLLVVNPNDPASLQIANAYAALRDIPANNILFLSPPPDYNNDGNPISQAEVTSYYLTPISNAIASRGLSSQINYIGTIGQAVSYSINPDSGLPYTTANSLSYALSLLTPLTNGSGLTMQGAVTHYNQNLLYAVTSGLYQSPTSIPINGAADAAVQHSASYSVTYYPNGSSPGTVYTTQYYMSGAIGYTGTNGNTVAQVISSLRNAAAADGTHPSGTFYFENSGDSYRSGKRKPEWSYTESQLTARGISWIEESSTTPLNRSNVLGATLGASTLTLPNGSTYLPGSWADNLTSYGCFFPDTSQTKATALIAAGAAGTTGAIVEPYNLTQRFTNSSIDTFIADGATLGEAFAKSVATPDIQLPLGDMLAQPLADVPKVVFNSGPGNYGVARGTISIAGSAGMSGARIATAISKLELVVDGLVSSSSTLAGGSGTFSLSTTGLSDGVHEVRLVAINNAKAASEGYFAEPIVVNNHGRSISFNGGNTTLTSSAASFNLATAAGDGMISQVELTCLGRVVAQAAGSPGSLNVSTSSLASGDNSIVPVAVFSDGSQVAGAAFVVHVPSGAPNIWSNGAGNFLWSSPANWSAGTLPQNGDGVVRCTGPSGGSMVLDVSANVQEIDIGGYGGKYTISAAAGQTLTLSNSSGPMSQSMIDVLGGKQKISAPLAISGPGTFVNVTSGTDQLTISGGISGAGAITKTGDGALVLTGSNTYGGTTTISAGTLQVGPGGTLGTGPVVDNSMLQLNRPDTFTLATAISGVGAVIQNGGGTLILNGSNSYTGGTRINSGNFVFSSPSAMPGSGAILLNKPGALNVTGAYTTVSGWLSSNRIDPASTGVLALVGTSNETINMSGYAGLSLGAAAAGTTYSGTLTPAGTTFALGGGGGALTVATNLAGARNVVIGGSGPGTVILSGSNSYSGGTQVYGGNVVFSTQGSLPSNGLVLLGSSGALNVAGAYSTVTGWLNSGVIDPASTGVLALGGTTNENINLENYSGLVIGAAAGGATYGGTLTPAGPNYAFGGGGGTLNVASNLGGSLSLTIGNAGPGTVFLSGTNTYTGDTIVTNGALGILHPWSLPDGGNVTVGDPTIFAYHGPVVPTENGLAASSAVSSLGAATVPEPNTLLTFLAVTCCALLSRVIRRSGR
jgi:uncharacterized protein (TIGR03790 family)